MKTLNIQSTRPTLDITSTKAELQIVNKMRRFRTETVRPEMRVVRQAPTMKVNWKKVWSDRGFRSPDNFRQYTQQYAKQLVGEAISNIRAHGDYFMNLKGYRGSDRNPVGEWALQQMLDNQQDITMAQPIDPPEVEWDPGYVKVEWTQGDVRIEWDDDFMPEFTVTPYSVEIRLEGRAEVKITVNEDRIASNHGKKVDKKI